VIESYGGIVVMAFAAVVCFVVGWSRSDETPRFVGYAFVAGACLFTFFSGGPAWLLIAAIGVFVVNMGVLIVNVARA
jgi:hypothetical protein